MGRKDPDCYIEGDSNNIFIRFLLDYKQWKNRGPYIAKTLVFDWLAKFNRSRKGAMTPKNIKDQQSRFEET